MVLMAAVRKLQNLWFRRFRGIKIVTKNISLKQFPQFLLRRREVVGIQLLLKVPNIKERFKGGVLNVKLFQ